MAAFKALEVSIGPKLAGFSSLLWAQRVPHRVFEDQNGLQVLVVARAEHVELVREAFARWQRGEAQPLPAGQPAGAGLGALFRAQPVTLVAIVLSVLGAALVSLDGNLWILRWLTFTDFHIVANQLAFDSVSATYGRGEYWRLLTPLFLHFGLLHLAFNLLWYWELGRRIERVRGSLSALAVLLITGAGGNIAQYIIDGSALFGGMSGVIYGLLGYAWMWTRVSGDPSLALPRGILVFMLAWLLLCMSGLVEALGFGAIANAAHGAGLALGMLLGASAALLYSPPRDPAP